MCPQDRFAEIKWRALQDLPSGWPSSANLTLYVNQVESDRAWLIVEVESLRAQLNKSGVSDGATAG